MEKIQVQPQQVFIINLKDKWKDINLVATQKDIDYYTKYHTRTQLTVLEDLGVPSIDCEITLESENLRRCYCRQDYKVRTKKELSDFDFRVLRAWRCFLDGQRHAEVMSHKVLDDGTIEYHLVSERDSGD